MRQQDALEYFQYLMTLIERDEHKREGGKHDVSKVFKFKVEERIEDSVSRQVKYSYREDNVLSLPIPLEKASNLGIILFFFLGTNNAEEVARYEAKKQREREEQEKLKKEGVELPRKYISFLFFL